MVMVKKAPQIIPSNSDDFERQFAYVDSIINRHRTTAIATVNMESLLTAWEVGQYISVQLKSSHWGSKVVSELADYLKRQNPKRRGFGKRNLYNMVKFFETYSTDDFQRLGEHLKLDEIVQLPIAQLEDNNGQNEIVQLPTAQLPVQAMIPMPNILALTTFTNHVEIFNRCNSYEESVFYMLYAHHQRLKTEELRRCIVTQTHVALLGKEKMMSPKLRDSYPNIDFVLKDKAIVDFLNLPQKHNEHHLHKGLIAHMKEFILELGKDFLFVDSEYAVQVGGSTRRIDLLFYHRLLQCLVAIELKTTEFDPRDLGQLEFYLEALDQTEKRSNENPSIGILMCKDANPEVVRYALNRSMSPTMIAKYEEQLKIGGVIQRSLEEFVEFISENRIDKNNNIN